MRAPAGLILAWRLGADGAAALDADGVAAWQPDDAPIWVHLDRNHPGVRAWLEEDARLEPLVAAALLEEETRPRVTPQGDGLEDDLDAFEQALIDEDTPVPSSARVSGIRRRAIELRRYLAPQRDVMTRLYTAPEPWLADADKLSLRETADRITRLVEDLDSARERGSVTHEEISERLSLRLGRIMYVLSLVATVFLPLTFITGLLGINVGGIPGAETGWAFAAVCALLVALLVVEVMLFRRWHWLD